MSGKWFPNFVFSVLVGGIQVRRLPMMNVDLIIAAEGTKGQWCENRYLITSFIIKQCGS